MVTVIGGRAGLLFTVPSLVETAFAWRSLGQLMLSPILTRDIPVLRRLFVLVSLAVIATNLLNDVAYGLAGLPRSLRVTRAGW